MELTARPVVLSLRGECWSMGQLSIKRVVVVSDAAAIRRVLLENCDNSEKDSGRVGGRRPHSAHTSFKDDLIVIGPAE